MDQLPVGIFWDFENVHPPSGTSGYVVVSKIRQFVEPLGCVSVFKAYLDVNLEAGKATQQHELQSSGVSLIHTPHNAKKEVADKVLIVDLMIFALESQTLKTIVLITGDRDFSYAASMLRLKGHRIFVVHPFLAPTPSLKNVAHEIFNWRVDVLERSTAVTENLASPTKGSSAPHATLTPPVAPLQLDHIERKSSAKDASGEGLRAISSKPALCCSCSELLLFAAENGTVNDMVVESGHLCAESPWSQPMLRLQTTLSEFANDASQVSAALPLDADPWSGQKGHPPKPKCPVHDDDSSSVLHAVGGEDKPADQSLDVKNPLASRQDGVLINESTPETDMEEEHSYGTDIESPLDQSVVSTPIYDECDAQEHIIFLDLIKVLKDERNRGRVSTPYDCLEVLLLQEDPWIFEQAGARGLKDYLELAERAAVVSCISADGKLNDCHVFLLDDCNARSPGNVEPSDKHVPQTPLMSSTSLSTSDAQKSSVPYVCATSPCGSVMEGARSKDEESITSEGREIASEGDGNDILDSDRFEETYDKALGDPGTIDKEENLLRGPSESAEEQAHEHSALDEMVLNTVDVQGVDGVPNHTPTLIQTFGDSLAPKAMPSSQFTFSFGGFLGASPSAPTQGMTKRTAPTQGITKRTAPTQGITKRTAPTQGITKRTVVKKSQFQVLVEVLKGLGASSSSVRQTEVHKALLKRDSKAYTRLGFSSSKAGAYYQKAKDLRIVTMSFGTTEATKNKPYITLCRDR